MNVGSEAFINIFKVFDNQKKRNFNLIVCQDAEFIFISILLSFKPAPRVSITRDEKLCFDIRPEMIPMLKSVKLLKDSENNIPK